MIVFLLAISIGMFLQHPKFGKVPSGARLQRIRQSPNFRNGAFQNLHVVRRMSKPDQQVFLRRQFVQIGLNRRNGAGWFTSGVPFEKELIQNASHGMSFGQLWCGMQILKCTVTEIR